MKDQQFKKVWAIPTYIGAITLLGLLTALLGTGLCYPLSWLAMSIPLMIMNRSGNKPESDQL